MLESIRREGAPPTTHLIIKWVQDFVLEAHPRGDYLIQGSHPLRKLTQIK